MPKIVTCGVISASISFWIAKATQSKLIDKTIYTQFQQFIGTRAYMSPEQWDMTSPDV